MSEEDEVDSKCDVFSFGLILYEILVGTPVFGRREPPLPVLRRVCSGAFPPIPPRCGEFMQRLICRCWAQKPGDRPSFEEILIEFRECDFDIVPDCRADEIRDFCDGILQWECTEAARIGGQA
jgi:hypothetical protein